MPTDKAEGLSLTVRNVDVVKQYIDDVARNSRGIVTEDIADYIIANGLKKQPPYKYVSRAAAYGGNGFQSDAQRRYVMAMIRAGVITPGQNNRTGTLKDSWTTVKDMTRVRIVNIADYASYVQGDISQSAHEYKAGWQKVNVIVNDNMEAAVRHAQEKLDSKIKDGSIKNA